MNFPVSLMARKILANSFSRRTLPRGESWLERKKLQQREGAERTPFIWILEPQTGEADKSAKFPYFYV
jgi:hypothetical protein